MKMDKERERTVCINFIGTLYIIFLLARLLPYKIVFKQSFQTIDFDTDSDCGRSEEPNLQDIRSGLYETESTQAYEPCEGFDHEDRPTTRPTEMTLTALTQTAQMPGEDGQVDEYETDSDCDETEIDGAGVDSDELALIRVQSRRTSRSGRTLQAAVRLDL